MAEVPFLSENLPLFAAAVLVLAYVVWSKYFSNKNFPMKPKKTNDLITILLIFLFLILNFFLTSLVVISNLNNNLFTLDLTQFFIASAILIMIFATIYVYMIAELSRKKCIEIFDSVKMLSYSSMLGFLLPTFVITRISIYHDFFTLQSISLFFLIIFFASLILLAFQIAIIQLFTLNKKKIKKIHIGGWKYFLFYFASFLLLFFILFSAFTITPQRGNIKPISYVIDDYSSYNPEAIKIIDVYYSKTFIGSNSKVLTLKIPDEIKRDYQTDKFFELYLEKNGTLSKVASYDEMGRNQIFGNITDIRVSANLLVLNFNNLFQYQDFDHFVIRGGVKQNVSDTYQVFPINNWNKYDYNKDTGVIAINFSINDSLDLENNQLGGYVLSFSNLGLGGDNCTFGTSDKNLILKFDKPCGFFSCSDWVCKGECGNWSISLQKDNNRVIFSSQNRREMGLLEVNSHLYCR